MKSLIQNEMLRQSQPAFKYGMVCRRLTILNVQFMSHAAYPLQRKKESKILLSALNEYFPSALGAGHWRLVQVSICKFQDTVISPRKMEGLQLQHLASRYLIKFTRS